MRLIKTILILLCFVSVSVNAQEAIVYSWPELAQKAVLLISKRTNSDSADSGTGIIIVKGGRYFLITAVHVSRKLKENTQIAFSDIYEKISTRELKSITKSKLFKFIEHNEADVSVIELFAKDSITSNLIKRSAFPFEQIRKDKGQLDRLISIISFGYAIVGENYNEVFSPLSFTSHVSSGNLLLKRGDNEEKKSYFFLSDMPSMQGFSGGPVFDPGTTSGISTLLGIMHGTQRDNTGVKMAAITPAFYIIELIELIE